jgi:prevent-host-death family protein
MSLSPTEDIRTVAELEVDPRPILKQVRETGRPVFLTRKGKANLVIMDAEYYEQNLKVANLARLIAEGEAHIQAGRTRSASEFFGELRRDKRISR